MPSAKTGFCKILLISDFAYPPHTGTERLVFGIAEWFTNKYGIQTDILTPAWSGEESVIKSNGVTIYRFKTHDIHSSQPKKRIHDYIRAGLKLEKYDIYHGFYTAPPLMSTIALAKLKGSKSIISLFTANQLEANFTNPIYKQVLIKFMRQSDAITTTLWSVEKYLKQDYFRGKNITTVPCWIEDHFFTKETRKKNSKKIILFVGRMLKEKGIYVLLNAFAKIRNKTNSMLVLIGPLYDSEKMVLEKTITDLGIKKDVVVLGYVSEKELATRYNSADIAVAPTISNDTLFTWTLLEAMASGKAIVSTESLDAPIDSGDLGVVIKPGDIKSLEEGMIKLLLDERFRHECGKNSRRVAESLFDKKAVMSKYLELYKKIVGL